MFETGTSNCLVLVGYMSDQFADRMEIYVKNNNLIVAETIINGYIIRNTPFGAMTINIIRMKSGALLQKMKRRNFIWIGGALMKLQRGNIVMANLKSVSSGSIQKFRRPYLIISNNKANKFSPVVTAVPMSSKTRKKKYLPTHCEIPADKVTIISEDFNPVNSITLCEQIVSIDVENQIEEVVATVTDKNLLHKITECVKVQIGVYEKFN